MYKNHRIASSFSFNERKAEKKLKDAGINENQAEAITDVVTTSHKDVMGLYSSIARLENNMETRFQKVEARFQTLENNMETRFQKVEARFQTLENNMETRFLRMEIRLLLYMITIMFSVIGIMKFFI